jgi:hypothetical protein
MQPARWSSTCRELFYRAIVSEEIEEVPVLVSVGELSGND